MNSEFAKTSIKKTRKLLSGLDAVSSVYLGLKPKLKRAHVAFEETLRIALEHETRFSQMSDKLLRESLSDFREQFQASRRQTQSLLPQALAAVKEAAKRQLGLDPYNEQLLGALALHSGFLIEMSTGEGKTLTAGLAAVLNGWTGKPCHVITVNDYLAGRDAAKLTPLFHFCGLSVASIQAEMDSLKRKTAYAADVVYVSSKEIIADFLRDRLWLGNLQEYHRRELAIFLGHETHINSQWVMRGIHTAIVDEADSVLIDEAVTPLIISKKGQNDAFIALCQKAFNLSSFCVEGRDYELEFQYKDISMLNQAKITLQTHEPALSDRMMSLVKQALIAKHFFHRDKHYVIQENKIVLVDEYTGRLTPQREMSLGLHQFIQIKEGVAVTTPSETMARLSFQRFYRFFHRLSGMTGTAAEGMTEFWHIYGLATYKIPEHKPCIRTYNPTAVFATQTEKYQEVVKKISHLKAENRPVLIGTRSIQDSEKLAVLLKQAEIPFRLLNAVQQIEEAMIVSKAGQSGAVTIATNMAGRGTDILLGKCVVKKGGLHVIATECHDAKRIDRQLFGRAARQGDPGSAQLYISLDDDIFKKQCPRWLRRGLHYGYTKQWPGISTLIVYLAGWAQKRAESRAFKQRKAVLKMDTWLDESLSFSYADVKE